MSFYQDFARHQTVKPCKPDTHPKTVEKLADGSMKVVFQAGNSTIIPADMPEAQAFVIFTMLSDEAQP